MSINFIIEIAFLVAAYWLITGLRKLSSPDTARKGNLWAAAGMTVAILAGFVVPLEHDYGNYLWIIAGMIVGGVAGLIWSKKVKMTDMPQLVSLFNGFGGACAVLLSLVEFSKFASPDVPETAASMGINLFTLIIGGIAFTGSVLAWAKLDGRVNDKKVTFRGHQWLNLLFLAVIILLTVLMIALPAFRNWPVYAMLTIIILIYGFSFVAPIGGADMPVVISLLNSFSGLSAAGSGLLYDNLIMQIGGILVGASGTILTVLMCNAMNRTLFNVIMGGFGSTAAEGGPAGGTQGSVKEVSLNDAAVMLFYSDAVTIIPGYGLAVAQAQKVVKELDDLLSANGVDVRYAIHPVAGRMPGHMNVLLAEANVPYPKLMDLDDANDQLNKTTVSVVIGANDVVNPAAETDASSPIYGMPVLQAWHAQNCIVIKRSMASGYAGIENPLFFHDRTKMLFGDAKAVLQNLVQEVKGMA